MQTQKPSAVLALIAALLGLGSCPVTSRLMNDPTAWFATNLFRLAICAVVAALAFVLLLALRDVLQAMASRRRDPQTLRSDDRSGRPPSTGALMVFVAVVVVFAATGAALGAFILPRLGDTGPVSPDQTGPVELAGGAVLGAFFGGTIGSGVGGLASAVVFHVQRALWEKP